MLLLLQHAKEGQACYASTAWSVGRDCHRRHHQVRRQWRRAKGMFATCGDTVHARRPRLGLRKPCGPYVAQQSAFTVSRIGLQLSDMHPGHVIGV